MNHARAPARQPLAVFRGSFKIATIAGVPVRIHWTFFILLAWAFGSGFAGGGSWAGGLSTLALVAAVFACVVAHEFGHILAARAFGVRTRDVTLLPIGGVAALERIPEKPWQELVVAVAGPLVNVVIAGALLPGLLWGNEAGFLSVFAGPADGGQKFIASLAAINIWLVLFNMIPAFPMDGGRVLRAVLAMFTDRVSATRAAARVGQVIAALMALLGILQGWPMLLVLAIFVFLGAGAESAGTEADERLRGVAVDAVMVRDFRVLAETDSLQTAVDALLALSQSDFPVTRDGSGAAPIVGLLTRADLVQGLARHGAAATVRDAMREPCAPMRPRDPAARALKELHAARCPLIPVVENGAIVGLLTPDNVAEAIMIRGALAQQRGAG